VAMGLVGVLVELVELVVAGVCCGGSGGAVEGVVPGSGLFVELVARVDVFMFNQIQCRVQLYPKGGFASPSYKHSVERSPP
jgi:hypothetical protein